MLIDEADNIHRRVRIGYKLNIP